MVNCSLITIDALNLAAHPQTVCFINPKHPSYPLKVEWLKSRFHEGLVIKLLYVEGEKRPAGFIEYVPGDQCWRAVTAPGYLFIHCIWVNAVKHKNKGLGSMLIEACMADAKAGNYNGVAVMTSSGSFMADKSLFLKNGFEVVAADLTHDLLVKQLKNAPLPFFNDWRTALKELRGLHMVYSPQCPWVARFVTEVGGSLAKRGIDVTVTELKTPQQAQAAPSPYAVFNLVRDGRLLADHYISETRLMNILRKEKLVN
jgi:hypothetical protein